MCNINVLIKHVGGDWAKELAFATAHSFATNDDSEGLFLSSKNTVIKSEDKIDIHCFKDGIRDSKFVLVHERIATSGLSFRYAHPFNSERFALVHNGIFGIHHAKHSDTYLFFESFCKHFQEEADIKRSIEMAMDDSKYGSYSVFIYDKQEEKGYYFKSEYTQISAVRLKDGGVYITTQKDNLRFFDYKNEVIIEAGKLYTFFHKGKKIKITQVALNIPKIESYNYGWYNTQQCKDDNKGMGEMSFDNQATLVLKGKIPCGGCGTELLKKDLIFVGGKDYMCLHCWGDMETYFTKKYRGWD